MKTYNCDARGYPTHTPRIWCDAWFLMFEMAMCIGVATFILITDIAERKESAHVQFEFKERINLAWTTVPDHLKMIKRRK